jgi:mannitol-1-phosphate 5-dehydrogenase
MAITNQQRPRAVVIGTGKIGCGYLAPLFAQAGWDVVLAGRSETVVERIGRAGDYTVRITGGGGRIGVNVRAVLIGSQDFERAVAGADVIATAVGAGSPASLGAPLARALAARGAGRPVDVWAVENADVAPILEAAVRAAAASEGLALPPVGFAGAIAYAAVTQGDWRTSRRPEFVGDSARWLLVDGDRLRCPLSSLPRVGATDRYHEHLVAKRFVFGAGHVLCAYLGARRGHLHIHDAANDPLIRPLVAGALAASRAALLATGGQSTGSVEWVMRRYANAELGDLVRRVGRDPIRKLSPAGPLVGPARLATRVTGRVPRGFAAGIAGALAYRDADDPQSCLLSNMLDGDGGVQAVLADVCGLDPSEPLAREVLRLWDGRSPVGQMRRSPAAAPPNARRRGRLAA